MPVSFLGHVIRGHCPQWLKPDRSNAKDRLYASMTPDLLPRSESRAKPLVEIRRQTQFDRYPTVDAVNRKIRSLPRTDSLAGVVRQTHHAIARKIEGRVNQPLLVLVGEQHGSQASLATVLTALNKIHCNGEKRLLVEQPPVWVQQHMAGGPAPQELAVSLRDNGRFQPAPHDAVLNSMTVISRYAALQNYIVDGFDPRHDGSPDNEHREEGMHAHLAQTLRGPAGAGGLFRRNGPKVTIVHCGVDHLPFLHEQFASKVNTLSIAVLGPVDAGDHLAAKRASYTLSTNEIVKINPTEQLDQAPLDPVMFIKTLDRMRRPRG